MNTQKAFTLIEVLIALTVISIMAAIVVPSYRKYMVRNTEYDVTVALGKIKTDLGKWHANNFSYKGFDEEYSDSKAKYDFTIADPDTGQSLKLTTLGARWVAFAEPKSSDLKGAKFLMFSSGVACQLAYSESSYASFDQTKDCTITGTKPL